MFAFLTEEQIIINICN